MGGKAPSGLGGQGRKGKRTVHNKDPHWRKDKERERLFNEGGNVVREEREKVHYRVGGQAPRGGEGKIIRIRKVKGPTSVEKNRSDKGMVPMRLKNLAAKHEGGRVPSGKGGGPFSGKLNSAVRQKPGTVKSKDWHSCKGVDGYKRGEKDGRKKGRRLKRKRTRKAAVGGHNMLGPRVEEHSGPFQREEAQGPSGNVGLLRFRTLLALPPK